MQKEKVITVCNNHIEFTNPDGVPLNHKIGILALIIYSSLSGIDDGK